MCHIILNLINRQILQSKVGNRSRSVRPLPKLIIKPIIIPSSRPIPPDRIDRIPYPESRWGQIPLHHLPRLQRRHHNIALNHILHLRAIHQQKRTATNPKPDIIVDVEVVDGFEFGDAGVRVADGVADEEGVAGVGVVAEVEAAAGEKGVGGGLAAEGQLEVGEAGAEAGLGGTDEGDRGAEAGEGGVVVAGYAD